MNKNLVGVLKRNPRTKKLKIISLVFVFVIPLLNSSCSFFCHWCEKRPDRGITLYGGDGNKTNAIDINDNLRVSITDLKPGTRYTIRTVDAEGKVLSYSRLTSSRNGVIPATTLLFAENLLSCASFATVPSVTSTRSSEMDEKISYSSHRKWVLQRAAKWVQSIQSHMYYVEVMEKDRIVRRAPFLIKDKGKPRIFVADRNGCPRSGLLQRKDDVYIIGQNFPAGSLVRLFVVRDQRLWNEGHPIKDITGNNGNPSVESIQLEPNQGDFFVRVWGKDSTTTGLYDVIARYIDSEPLSFNSMDVVTAINDVGLIIQTDASSPHIEQNMTVPSVNNSVLYYMFQDKYFNTDDVWVAVNPKDRPGGLSGPEANARIYVVNHLDESQWVHGTILNDVSSNNFEDVPIKGSCRNQNEILVWEAPLTNGNYDVVVDFPPYGVYDQGQDIVDELDNVGFQVINPVPFAIVYPVNNLRVFPEKEVPTGPKVDYFYAVAKINPAVGGTSIYWDSLDIDDPSSDTAPVDPNGAAGNDNRGNFGAAPGAPDGDDGHLDGENASGIATSTTYSNGIAVVRFQVTMQPGDNFTVRASTSSDFSTYEDSAPITVWRKLHVEIDSMGAPSGTTETGNITNVNYDTGTNTSQVTVDIVLDDGGYWSTGGRFENGVLTAGGNNYTVMSNTSSVLTVQGNPPNGVSFQLVDDDVVPTDVGEPDVGDMVRAYARAFILPVFDTGEDTNNVPFDLNTEMSEISGQINAGKGTPMSTGDYWTVAVQGAFQTSKEDPSLGGDNDPDNEGTWRGVADSYAEGVLICQESIRDWIQAPVAKGGGGGVDPDNTGELPRRPRRQEILVHEVGHILSLSHADGAVTAADPFGGVMLASNAPRQSSNFTQRSLNKLRSIAKPGI